MTGGGRGVEAGLSALAAVFGEVREHAVHLAELDAVDQVAPTALLADQAGAHKFLEVKRERGVGHPEVLAQLTGCRALLARDDERAEHLQPVGLSQGGKGFDNVFLFHFSIIVEIYDKGKTLQSASLDKGNRGEGGLLMAEGCRPAYLSRWRLPLHFGRSGSMNKLP